MPTLNTKTTPTTPATEQEEADRDLDMWEMEKEWKASQKQRTEVEWLAIFPQAKSKFGKLIFSTLKWKLKELDWQLVWVKFKTNKDLEANPADSRWRDDLIKDYGRREVKRIEKETRHTHEQIALLHRIGNKKLQEKEGKVIITEAMIQKAKEYPLDQLVQVNKQGFAKCVWHNDKNPSMFCKKNFANCFSCNNNGDTIAVLRQRDKIGFREAVLKLQ